jgi:acetoin utilization protein AcuB
MLNDTPISEIMTRYLITVSPNTTLDKIRAIFQQHDFHHLPVVDGEQLVGILSRIDVDRVSRCLGLFHSKSNQEYNDRLFQSLLAEEVMTKTVKTIAPEEPVGYAAVLFSENKFHALPVVERGQLVVMVTTFDLMEFAYNRKMKPVLVA